MSRKTREELIARLNEQVQDNGNTNVLLVNAIAQQMNLSASEFECASLIRDHGPFTAGELARRCRISTGGMTGMIDRLVKARLVERVPDDQDRRRVLVRGIENKQREAQARELYSPLASSFHALLDEYSDDQIAFLVNFMERINAMFHETIDSIPQKEK